MKSMCDGKYGRYGKCSTAEGCGLRNCPAQYIAKEESAATKVEPPPIKNNHPAAWDLVRDDMLDRDNFGKAKYNTRLQPHNGRDALADAYQEALDLCVYLRQAIYERDGE